MGELRSWCHYNHRLAVLAGAYGCWAVYIVPIWGVWLERKILTYKPSTNFVAPSSCIQLGFSSVQSRYVTVLVSSSFFVWHTQTLRANLILAKIGQKITPISPNSKVGDFGDIVAKSCVSVRQPLTYPFLQHLICLFCNMITSLILVLLTYLYLLHQPEGQETWTSLLAWKTLSLREHEVLSDWRKLLFIVNVFKMDEKCYKYIRKYAIQISYI